MTRRDDDDNHHHHVNGSDYVSELQPPTGLLFIRPVIYEHGVPWMNDIERRTPDSSTRALWQFYQQIHLVANRKN
jgi:hypothetical protein